MRLRTLLALLVLFVGTAAGASAQADSCDLIESQAVNRDPLSGNIVIAGPFRFECRGGAVLRALNGTLNEFSRELVLTGDVFFQDPDQTLTADNATYTSTIGRLYATGNVVFANRRDGSTIRGPELEYFRPMEGRPDPQVNATRRPHLTLRPKEAKEGSEPLELDADRVNIQGENQLSAYGNVIIERTDLDARAEEAQYDQETEGLELRGNARIESGDFDLSANVIQARIPEGALEHVQARTDASLQGEELTVTAPELQMFFEGEKLQRAVARSGEEDAPRPVAVARNFRLEADSIDAITPGQRIDRVIAIGGARGEQIDTTTADSAAVEAPAPDTAAAPRPARPDTAEARDPEEEAADSAAVAAASALIVRDWIVGDTLIGYFEAPDSAAAGAEPDTAAVLKRIVASGNAQSLYRVEAQDSTGRATGRRGVNYLSGDTIELSFEEGELHTANVTGLKQGIYLDPTPPGGAPAGTPAARTRPAATTPRRPGGGS